MIRDSRPRLCSGAPAPSQGDFVGRLRRCNIPDGRLIVATLSESGRLLIQIAQVLPSLRGGSIWTATDQGAVDQRQDQNPPFSLDQPPFHRPAALIVVLFRVS